MFLSPEIPQYTNFNTKIIILAQCAGGVMWWRHGWACAFLRCLSGIVFAPVLILRGSAFGVGSVYHALWQPTCQPLTSEMLILYICDCLHCTVSIGKSLLVAWKYRLIDWGHISIEMCFCFFRSDTGSAIFRVRKIAYDGLKLGTLKMALPVSETFIKIRITLAIGQ